MAVEDDGYEIPTYKRCFMDVYRTMSTYIKNEKESLFNPLGFYKELQDYGDFPLRDLAVIIGLAVFWTIFRYFLTSLILEPYAKKAQMTLLNQKKFPESAFKLLFYCSTWAYSIYLLFIKEDRYTFFEKPLELWEDWHVSMYVPTDMYLMYMIQCSFYLHSVYGTMYMDQWRKDSVVMMFHHFLTLSLIGFSYAGRFHKIGILVLFVHDITDICLEFTKVNVYLKNRGGKVYKLNDALTTAGFLCFASTWFLFRLYWFPLKILHSAGFGTFNNTPDGIIPFVFFFNVLLWILQLLNIYWFTFIINFLYKVATGQIKEVDDTREFEVAEKARLAALKKDDKNANIQETNGAVQHGDSIPNGAANTNGTTRRAARLRKDH